MKLFLAVVLGLISSSVYAADTYSMHCNLLNLGKSASYIPKSLDYRTGDDDYDNYVLLANGEKVTATVEDTDEFTDRFSFKSDGRDLLATFTYGECETNHTADATIELYPAGVASGEAAATYECSCFQIIK